MNKNLPCYFDSFDIHYNGVKMESMASQIISLALVYSAVYSGADKKKHQNSASLTFVRGIHGGPVKFPAQMASNTENVSIWWRHHAQRRDRFTITTLGNAIICAWTEPESKWLTSA